MNKVIECYEKDRAAKETYNMMSKIGNLHDMQQALILYTNGMDQKMSYTAISHQPNDESGRPNEILQTIFKAYVREFKSEIEADQFFSSTMCELQKAVQVLSWKKSKQTFVFDQNLSAELCDTDTSFSIPKDVFEYLPYKTFYLDFSENKELCKDIGIDGSLVKVTSIPTEAGKEWLVSTLEYRNGEFVSCNNNFIQTGKDDITLEDIIVGIETYDKLKETVEELRKSMPYLNDLPAANVNLRKLMSLQLQSLLYLSSAEPDIYEKELSKSRFRHAKQNKKLNKSDMPEREYQVGERFGNAFRTWTEGSLGQGSNKSEPTGRHNRPHIRKAHWHRYWVGKKDSDDRKLIIRWLHPTFCGLEEQEAELKLDKVKHKTSNSKKFKKGNIKKE